MQWENADELKRAEDFLKNQKEMKATLFMSIGNEPGFLVERHRVTSAAAYPTRRPSLAISGHSRPPLRMKCPG